MRVLLKIDGLVARTWIAWGWLGQVALVVLGVHLAADRLDDLLLQVLTAGLPGTDAALRQAAATWTAVVLELLVGVRVLAAVLFTSPHPELSWRSWWARRSVDAFVLPVFWALASFAGAWAVAMGVEDLLVPWVPDVAFWGGVAVASVVAWRLGWTGVRRVVGALDEEPARLSGLLWAPLLLGCSALVVRFAMPVWGW